jgi:hypothetical protein
MKKKVFSPQMKAEAGADPAEAKLNKFRAAVASDRGFFHVCTSFVPWKNNDRGRQGTFSFIL